MILLKDLPNRQRELIRYLADGHSNDEIAMLMGISTQTVKNMVSNLCERTGSSNRYRLVLHFYRIVRKGKPSALPVRLQETDARCHEN